MLRGFRSAYHRHRPPSIRPRATEFASPECTSPADIRAVADELASHEMLVKVLDDNRQLVAANARFHATFSAGQGDLSLGSRLGNILGCDSQAGKLDL